MKKLDDVRGTAWMDGHTQTRVEHSNSNIVDPINISLIHDLPMLHPCSYNTVSIIYT